MFYARIFRTKFWRQKLQSCAKNVLLYEKRTHKKLIKLTPDESNHTKEKKTSYRSQARITNARVALNGTGLPSKIIKFGQNLL